MNRVESRPASVSDPHLPAGLAPVYPFPPPPEDLEDWFLREIHPQRDRLRRWLIRRFPGLRDVEDLLQECCVRVWRRQQRRPLAQARAYLFQVAHHLAVDRFRRERASPLCEATGAVVEAREDESVGPADDACQRQELELLNRAIATLPRRCREIFILRKLRGVPQKEVARRLRLSEHTVQGQAHRGLRRCGQLLAREGVPGRAA